MLTHRRSSNGRWGAPVRIVHALRRARTSIPAPIMYVYAALAGVALGALLDLTVGWPWWMVAAGMVVAVWLIFLSTAFAGAGMMPQSLWGELVDAASPRGRFQRLVQREEEIFRGAPFPLFGLPPSWVGPRFLGGAGTSGVGRRMEVTSLGLGHGDPTDPEGPELRVESRIPDPEEGPEPREWVRRELASEMWYEEEGPPDDLTTDRFEIWMEEREESIPDDILPFSTIEIRVDESPMPFDYLSVRNRWAAVGGVDGVTVVLEGRDLDIAGVELATIEDIEPYAEGSRRLHAAEAGDSE